MRCPKCGYISFDIIESCVKCGKDITNAATDLEGSVAGVPAPTFLRVPGQEPPSTSEVPEEYIEEGAEESLDLGADADEEPLDLGEVAEEESVDFSLDDESSGEVEEAEIDLGEEETEIDLGEEDSGADDELPEIDLGEEGEAETETDFGLDEEPQEEEAAIGISDLAPSDEADETQLEESVAAEAETEGEAEIGQVLEGLDVDGIDGLESNLEAGDVDKVAPSVKTGTALDDFEVDLGDLMSSKD